MSINHSVLNLPLSAPANLTWEITRQCNLNCRHCLSSSGLEMPEELNLEECLAIADQLAALRVFEINFGGGEPLLKSFFLSLLDYIHQRGIVTCISTNGTMLTDEAVDFFADNPLANIQVSLDGATPEVNDSIRGQGTFHEIMRSVERLAKRNISLSINTVVTSLNFEQLGQLKELAQSLGARLRVSRFRPSGRAKDTWEKLRLNASQIQELAIWLNQDHSILTGDSFFPITGEDRKELGLNMCGACKLTCCIDPCGSVYPCAFLQEPEFCAGNLKEHPFKEIWDHAPVFHNFRELEPTACRQCPRFDICHGGCPAVAYFIRKDLNSPDPECLANYDLVAASVTLETS